jgi:hypothetical protein
MKMRSGVNGLEKQLEKAGFIMTMVRQDFIVSGAAIICL